jgi:hypothetical protein
MTSRPPGLDPCIISYLRICFCRSTRKPRVFVAFVCRFDPDPEIESVLDNNTDENVDLSGKFMRFLKDRECNNGENHSTQGDCRAKAPIHISETRSVQVGRRTIRILI